MQGRVMTMVNQTTCPRGHAKIPENRYIDPNGDSHCRPCRDIAQKKYDTEKRAARRASSRKASVAKRQRPEYKEYMRQKGKEYAKRNPLKASARRKLQKAVFDGKIVRPESCPTCGKVAKIEGHHTDYSKPYDVVWACKQCHENIHHGEVS